MADPSPFRDRKEGMPLWVKIQGVLLVLFLLIIIGMYTGVLASLLLPGGHTIPQGGHG